MFLAALVRDGDCVLGARVKGFWWGSIRTYTLVMIECCNLVVFEYYHFVICEYCNPVVSEYYQSEGFPERIIASPGCVN